MSERSLWDSYATYYGTLTQNLPSYARLMTAVTDALAIAVTPPASVLDAGCGVGNYALRIAGAGYRVTAVDGSKEMLNRVENAAAYATLPIEAVLADLNEPLPFDTDRFDAAVSVMVLYALRDGGGFLRELRRVVRFGGCLIIVTVGDRNLMLPAATEILRERGFVNALRGLGTLLASGVINARIDRRFRSDFRDYSIEDLTLLSTQSGWRVESATACYLDRAGLMMVLRAV